MQKYYIGTLAAICLFTFSLMSMQQEEEGILLTQILTERAITFCIKEDSSELFKKNITSKKAENIHIKITPKQMIVLHGNRFLKHYYYNTFKNLHSLGLKTSNSIQSFYLSIENGATSAIATFVERKPIEILQKDVISEMEEKGSKFQLTKTVEKNPKIAPHYRSSTEKCALK